MNMHELMWSQWLVDRHVARHGPGLQTSPGQNQTCYEICPAFLRCEGIDEGMYRLTVYIE
jgi:hypothetical protein